MSNPIARRSEAKVIAALRADAQSPRDPEVRERVLRRLEASVSARASGTSLEKPAAADGSARRVSLRRGMARVPRLSPAWRAAAVSMALGAVAAASVRTAISLRTQGPSRTSSGASSVKRPAPSRSPGPPSAAKLPSAETAAPAAAAEQRPFDPVPPASAGRPHTPGPFGPVDPVPALAAELAALEPARSALAAGNYDAALAATEAHARRFPRGVLAQEREALTIQALGRAGRSAEAQQRARQFEQRYPSSALLDSVKGSVGSNP